MIAKAAAPVKGIAWKGAENGRAKNGIRRERRENTSFHELSFAFIFCFKRQSVFFFYSPSQQTPMLNPLKITQLRQSGFG